MDIYKRFVKLLTVSTYIGVFFIRIFQYGFIYRNPIAIVSECIPTVLITGVLIFAVVLAERRILLPFEKILKVAKREERPLSQTEEAACLDYYKRYDKAIAIGEGIGFLLGAGSTSIVESLSGVVKFNPVLFVIIILQSIGVGFLCYTIMIYMIKKDMMTMALREAGVKSVSTSASSNVSVTIAICLYFAVMNTMVIPIGLLMKFDEKILLKFVGDFCIAAFFTAAACYLAYSILIKRMQKFERDIKQNLANETENLANAAKQSAAASQDQSAAVKEIVATMQDSNSLNVNISEKIQNVASLSARSRQEVLDGTESLKTNVGKLSNVIETNQQTIDGIKDLNGKIEQVWDVVSFINDMADQAKIIAFNAELEASSAGESGKNFHIVATEVRRLSDNIIDGTKEIKEKISEIQRASGDLILKSEDGSVVIDESCKSVMSLEDKFLNIEKTSELAATSSSDIISYVQQLTAASDQIFIALKQLASGVENCSQASDNVSVSSESVKNIASEL